VLTLDEHPLQQGQPIMLTEFGGIALRVQRDNPLPVALPTGEATEQVWGYSVACDEEEFAELYARLLKTIVHAAIFSGFCYTQFADMLAPAEN
jgi:hypothetical protein